MTAEICIHQSDLVLYNTFKLYHTNCKNVNIIIWEWMQMYLHLYYLGKYLTVWLKLQLFRNIQFYVIGKRNIVYIVVTKNSYM